MEYKDLLDRAYEKMPKKLDTADRFKVPQAEIEIVGPKTVFRNFEQIAASLRRDRTHVAKFLTRELAVPGAVQGTTLAFQGRVGRDILQKKINDYIKEFVYCKQCGEPDTRLEKDGRIMFMVCEACGARRPVRSL